MAVRTHAVPLDDAALAWLALALVPELLPRRALALVERFGTPRAVLEAPAGALAAADVPPAVVASVGRASSRARAETLKLAAAGSRPPPSPPPRRRAVSAVLSAGAVVGGAAAAAGTLTRGGRPGRRGRRARGGRGRVGFAAPCWPTLFMLRLRLGV